MILEASDIVKLDVPEFIAQQELLEGAADNEVEADNGVLS